MRVGAVAAPHVSGVPVTLSAGGGGRGALDGCAVLLVKGKGGGIVQLAAWLILAGGGAL